MKNINWKLVLGLSLFGLAMGIATVFVIPSKIEPFFWLGVFLISAFLIAKNASGNYFLHGFLTSLGNCVWVTGSHILLFQQYAANHPEEMSMMSSMPMPTHPRAMMLLMGPLIGIASGIVLGLFSWLASLMVKK